MDDARAVAAATCRITSIGAQRASRSSVNFSACSARLSTLLPTLAPRGPRATPVHTAATVARGASAPRLPHLRVIRRRHIYLARATSRSARLPTVTRRPSDALLAPAARQVPPRRVLCTARAVIIARTRSQLQTDWFRVRPATPLARNWIRSLVILPRRGGCSSLEVHPRALREILEMEHTTLGTHAGYARSPAAGAELHEMRVRPSS